MARLDSYTSYPSGMEEYLSYYGWHFSKKMFEWATGKMYRKEGVRKVKIDVSSKEDTEKLLKKYNIKLTKDYGYDAAYVVNMCKADYYGTSVRDESSLAAFVRDTLEDPDGYNGMVFTRFYADCIGSGTPIMWEDML